MDPVSAIGVAAGVIAFIDFAWNLAAGAHKLGQSVSDSGSIADDTHVLTIIGDLQAVSAGLRVLDRRAANYEFPAHLPALNVISEDCSEIAAKLLAALKRLQSSNTDHVWRKLKIQWMRMREEEKLQDMVEKLRDYRLQIIVRLNLILRCQLRGLRLALLFKWMLIRLLFQRSTMLPSVPSRTA